MFSVRQVPWHREGIVTDDYPQTFAEARALAGLDWDPVAYPVTSEQVMTAAQFRERARDLIMSRGELSADELASDVTSLWLESFRRPVNDVVVFGPLVAEIVDSAADDSDQWRRIARSDTGATLSYQRASYRLIPNSDFGEIIDAVTGSDSTVKLETGGCLDGGRRVWMLARLDEPHQVTARGRIDASYSFPYLGVTSDHTGKASCAARLTEVRIVCGNTYSLAEAEGERTGAVFSFSHRGDWRDRVTEAREALQFARNEAREYTEVMSGLLGIAVTPAQQQLWLREFIPAPPDGIVSDRVMANIETARAAVLGFLNGPTVEGAGIGGTAYGLVQAAGEYLDWARRANSWESRLNRNLLKAEPLKAKAAALAREAALA
jgi:phage/plasmid-like protein (TIGR03299 family)